MLSNSRFLLISLSLGRLEKGLIVTKGVIGVFFPFLRVADYFDRKSISLLGPNFSK